MKKTYFMQTFRVSEVMMFILSILMLIRVVLKFVANNFLLQTSENLSLYLRMMNKAFMTSIGVINWLLVIFSGIILLIIIPELINRITRDSVINWVRSIGVTYKMRKFMVGEAKFTEQDIRTETIIQNSIIDIRNHRVTYLLKLPHDMQAHRRFMAMEDIVYKEITNQFPGYCFSQFERYKNWLQIDGTRIE